MVEIFFLFFLALVVQQKYIEKVYLVETFTKLCLLDFQLKKDADQMGWQRGSNYLPISSVPNSSRPIRHLFRISPPPLHPHYPF